MRNTQKPTVDFLVHEKSKNEKGQRRTIAGKIVGSELRIGVSICGPRDQFNRKLGNTIASGRAEKKPSKVLTLTNDDNSRDVFYDALKTL